MSQLLLEAWLYSWAIIEYVSVKCMRTRSESLHWCHNDHDGVSNHQPHGCLLNRLFRRRSKKKNKSPRHWPLCWEFTATGEIPAQRASYAENVSIWWRHHMVDCFPIVSWYVKHIALKCIGSFESCMAWWYYFDLSITGPLYIVEPNKVIITQSDAIKMLGDE